MSSHVVETNRIHVHLLGSQNAPEHKQPAPISLQRNTHESALKASLLFPNATIEGGKVLSGQELALSLPR